MATMSALMSSKTINFKSKPTTAKRDVIRANLQQGLRVLEDFLFVWGATCWCEGVSRVTGEAAGEVAPVVGIVTAGHRDLVTGIELRHAANGEQQGKSVLKFFRGPARFAHEPLDVVIAEEGHK